MIKKIIVITLLVAMLFSFPSQAVNPLIFTAINDVIQLNPTPSNVPIVVGGYVYILPDMFSLMFGIKSFHNANYDRFLMYTDSENIVFDLKNNNTTDEAGELLPVNAIKRNGKIYIPAKLVCDKFGLKYSYITSSSLGSIVRINQEANTFDDSFFLEKNVETMRNIYLRYVKTYLNTETVSPTNPIDNDPDVNTPTDPTKPVKSKTVKLSVLCENIEGTDKMLKEFSKRNQRGAFFVTEDVAKNSEIMREIYTSNHQIGIAVLEGESLEKAEQINDIIKSQLMTKTNMVLLMDGKDSENIFEENGYKIYNYSYKPQGKYSSMVANSKLHIQKRNEPFLLFGTDENSVKAAGYMVSYMRQNNYIVSNPTIFD